MSEIPQHHKNVSEIPVVSVVYARLLDICFKLLYATDIRRFVDYDPLNNFPNRK